MAAAILCQHISRVVQNVDLLRVLWIYPDIRKMQYAFLAWDATKSYIKYTSKQIKMTCKHTKERTEREERTEWLIVSVFHSWCWSQRALRPVLPSICQLSNLQVAGKRASNHLCLPATLSKLGECRGDQQMTKSGLRQNCLCHCSISRTYWSRLVCLLARRLSVCAALTAACHSARGDNERREAGGDRAGDGRQGVRRGFRTSARRGRRMGNENFQAGTLCYTVRKQRWKCDTSRFESWIIVKSSAR